MGMRDDGNGIDRDQHGGGEAQDQGARRRPRTRAEAMGIGPDLPRKGESEGVEKTASKDSKRQLEAAERALEAARAEARENVDKYVRVAAEMDNMRRRHRQEQADQLQYANAELIAKLLP